MYLTEGNLAHTARNMVEKKLLRQLEVQRANTKKYSQLLCNTLLGEYQFSQPEFAVVCLLMLRGPQTPGELRTRSGRLYGFADNQEVAEVLQGLIDREKGPVVARLPKKVGRQDHEYCHLFAEQVESVAETVVGEHQTANRSPSRLSELESRVAKLEAVVIDLATRLGESVDLQLRDAESDSEHDDNDAV